MEDKKFVLKSKRFWGLVCMAGSAAIADKFPGVAWVDWVSFALQWGGLILASYGAMIADKKWVFVSKKSEMKS